MRTLSMRIVSYLIEYLGEFELIFETIMNQGTRWVLLMQKKRHRKSHAWAPLNRQFKQRPGRACALHFRFKLHLMLKGRTVLYILAH